MHQPKLKAAGFAAALFVVANAAPAFAEYGAFARDEATGKYGLSWNEANQKQADDAAQVWCSTVVHRAEGSRLALIVWSQHSAFHAGAEIVSN